MIRFAYREVGEGGERHESRGGTGGWEDEEGQQEYKGEKRCE